MKRPCLTCGAAAIGKTIPRPSKVVRGGFMQAWFYPILAGAALLLAAVVLRRRIWRAVTRGKTLPVLLPVEERPTYPMRHLDHGL